MISHPTANFEATEETVTLHGLGFIQIRLNKTQRLHVWHPDLPRRKCFAYSSIHDHRFGFVSQVLVGGLINRVYFQRPANVQDPATHISYLHEGERTKYGNRPWVPDKALVIGFHSEQLIGEGHSYSMLPYVYHSSVPSPNSFGVVVTLMTKTEENERGAHSLCEAGTMPDADFDRKQWSERTLWDVVVRCIGRRTLL